MIRGIIFDCFGVLYVNARRTYFSNFPEQHDALYDLDKLADHGYIGRRDYITSVAEITGISETETAKAFAHEYTVNKQLIDYIKRQLKPSHKIGLLSNIGREWIQDFFDTQQLHDLFTATVLSGEEGITKPNPLIFERTAQRLGLVPEECIMIDDRSENCQAANKIGMKSIVYTSNDQLQTGIEAIIKENL